LDEQELRGNGAHPIIHFQHADGSAFPEEDCELLKVRTKGRAIRVLDDAFTRKDGSIMPVAYSAAPLLNGTNVSGVIVAFRDTTEERAERTRVQRELNALTWVGRIREALDEERFVLYSQPIVPLRGGQASVELLLRMLGATVKSSHPEAFSPSPRNTG